MTQEFSNGTGHFSVPASTCASASRDLPRHKPDSTGMTINVNLNPASRCAISYV